MRPGKVYFGIPCQHRVFVGPTPENKIMDKEIHPLIIPVYERLKAKADAKSPINVWTEIILIDGKKITCMYALNKMPTGLMEQFEYYEYKYLHFKDL